MAGEKTKFQSAGLESWAPIRRSKVPVFIDRDYRINGDPAPGNPRKNGSCAREHSLAQECQDLYRSHVAGWSFGAHAR